MTRPNRPGQPTQPHFRPQYNAPHFDALPIADQDAIVSVIMGRRGGTDEEAYTRYLRTRLGGPLVVCVGNIKGGAGKTSTAVSVGYAAFERGESVMVLDLDPEPSASRWIDAAALASEAFGSHTLGPESLETALDAATEAGVQLVIIDTPAQHKDILIQAMSFAHLVLIPMHNGTGDIDNLPITLRLLGVPLRVNPNLQVMAVLNHTGSMTAVTRRTRAAVEALNLTVADTEIPFRQMYAEAKGSQPVGEHYADLWAEVWGVMLPELDEVRAGVAGVGF